MQVFTNYEVKNICSNPKSDRNIYKQNFKCLVMIAIINTKLNQNNG